MQMYTSLHTGIYKQEGRSIRSHCISLWNEHAPEGKLEQEQEGVPCWCSWNKSSGNKARNNRDHGVGTNSANQDRLSKGKSKDFELRAPREWRRMSFDPTQTQNPHIYKSV